MNEPNLTPPTPPSPPVLLVQMADGTFGRATVSPTFLKTVKAVQDNDFNWYVIPAELLTEFRALEDECQEKEDYQAFEETFSKYRTGGHLNNVTLYADV